MTTKWTTSLFWFQVVMAWTHVIFQAPEIVKGNVDGLSLVFYSVFFMYVVFSLALSVSSYRADKTKDRKQTIIIFIHWAVFLASLFVLGLGKIPWTKEDTTICIAIAVMIGIAVWAMSLYSRDGIKDPFTKASIAMISKGVPQMYLAYVVWDAKSSEGLPLVALITAHMTSIARLVNVFLSGQKDGWDRPTKALFCGEVVNVSTWCVFTGFWVYFRI